jgi:hypothetical protein
MFVAIMVMNSTLASSGRAAMSRTASVTCPVSISGSARIDPSAWGTPVPNAPVISVAALPMSIWPQAIWYGRPSSEIALVRPVMACLLAV